MTKEVTTPEQNNIPKMIEKINEQIKAIKKNINDTPNTADKQLQGYGKIKDINSVSKLTRAAASVMLRAEYYTNAANKIGTNLKKYPAKIDGASPKAWLEDIEARVVIISHKDQLDRLNKAKTLLESHLSEKDKLQRDMEKIADLFTDD